MKIIIASDHAGYELKEKIINKFQKEFEFDNYGPFSSESVDYPDFAHPVADKITKGEFEYGILICGTGNGIGMTANKHAGIRAALCWNKEIAALARQHNNANVLVNYCTPAVFILNFSILDTHQNATHLGAPGTGFSIFCNHILLTGSTILNHVNRRNNSCCTASASFFKSADFIQFDMASLNNQSQISGNGGQTLVGNGFFPMPL